MCEGCLGLGMVVMGVGMRSVFGCFESGDGRLGLASSLVVDLDEGGEKYDGIGEYTRGEGRIA